jgi:DNA-binding NarL/FixJ family response regulator
MREQQLQYASTRDGVSIAFAVSGSGPVLVHMPNMGVSTLLLERTLPERRRWQLALEQHFTVIRYDARAHGFSQRSATNLSSDAHALDLEAVVEKAGIDRFALLGFLGTSLIAPAYAASQPQRVTHLILWPPDTRESSAEEYRGLNSLAVSDWQTFTETYAHLALGWDLGEAAHRYAVIMRESIEHATFLKLMANPASLTRLLQDQAPRVQCPTLILERHLKHAADRVARLAASFPNSRLLLFEGEQTLPYLGNVGEVIDAIRAFVSSSGEANSSPPVPAGHADPGRPPGPRPAGLSEREAEVLGLLPAGLTNQQIADELVLSVRTIERHLANAYDKIGASGSSARAAAAAFALKHGLA